MRTHAGRYPLTQVAALRVHAESAVLYPWHERPPSGRCGSQRSIACLFVQRPAGSCDDATNNVATPLQRRIACCNSAQQVRSTTQPTLLPIRCSGASRVATVLSATSQNCCTRVQSVATVHRMLQQRTILLQNRSTLHLLQRVATVQPLVMPVAAQCNLLWRNRTCCKKRTTTVMHTSAICCSRFATDHSPLQQTTARCNLLL
jgi:hypothetical protein